MKNSDWIKILVWAVIIHILLIAVTIAEVFVFSGYIQPNKGEQFYQEHVRGIAPYVAIIIGFILIFFVAKRLFRKIENNGKWIGVLLAIAYIIIDMIILQISSVNWSEHYPIFLVSFLTKLIAGYLGVLDFKKLFGK